MNLTPNQALDDFLTSCGLNGYLPDRQGLKSLRVWSEQENNLRAAMPGWHVCPRCRGAHSIQGNHDGLCDRCCGVILSDFPDWELATLVKSARQKFKETLAASAKARATEVAS